MADEDLFESDEELDSEFKEIKPPPKKRRRLKWFFLLLLLIIIAAAVVLGLNQTGFIHLPINSYLPIENLFQGTDKTAGRDPGKTISPSPMPLPPPEMPLETEAKKRSEAEKAKAKKGGTYLKVGSCIDERCRTSLSRKIENLQLPLVTREHTESTVYYELLSDTSYLKNRAEEKLRLLNKYNKTIGFPYLLPLQKDRYIISFGQFPDKVDAIQMKAQLEQLYPQIRMRFAIYPRKDKATITDFYVGPFQPAVAEKTRMKLRDALAFEWIEVTRLN